jgi:hypothetical protein
MRNGESVDHAMPPICKRGDLETIWDKNSLVARVFSSDLKLQLRLSRRQMQYRSEAEL